MRKLALLTLFSLACAAYILAPNPIFAQDSINGTWTAGKNSKQAVDEKFQDEAKSDTAEKLHISFSRTLENGKNQHSTNYKYSDLEGLTAAQVQGGGPVRFRIVREAGTIEAEGSFADGRGSGTFTFNPNAGYVSNMRSKGFDFEKTDPEKWGGNHDRTVDRLFAAATLNVTTTLADDLNSANFPNLAVDDLFKAAIFKIDGKFMAEMQATGFPNLKMEDLVKARIFKIDADYVREINQMGFADQGFERLVKFRIFKVTPEFLSELRAAGLDKMSAEDIVKARIFKIDGAFIRDARASEPNISMEELVQIKIGVRRRH